MDMAEAINYPRMYAYTTSGKPSPYIVEDQMPELTLKALEVIGEKLIFVHIVIDFGTSPGHYIQKWFNERWSGLPGVWVFLLGSSF